MNQEAVEKMKAELVGRGSSWLIRAGNVNSVRSEACIQLVEDGKAHASRAQGSGHPVWWVHCFPYGGPEHENPGLGFPHTSQRNSE